MANYTILLIDYEPRSIERFREPLVGAGYGIEIATDGVSGIEAFHRLNPDMVLVEAMIPKKHGFEVCQELKRTPHGRKTPVIITTGVYKGRKYRTQALHIYGCDEYIEKPIAPEQLLEIVGKFLKPGPSGPPPKPSDPGPGQAESGGSSGSHQTGGSVAKTVTMKAMFAPHALADDDTEDEIMARLDAILPSGDTVAPGVFAKNGAALAAAVDPIAIIPLDIEAASDDDPFAQIRAELNAELGALPTPADFEAVDPDFSPEVIHSDQAPAPSVLEALPIPESEVPIPPLPEPPPILPVERPGQVVDFDSKRSRKNKKSRQNKGRPAEAPTSRATQPIPIVAPQEAPAHRALEPVASVAELTLPRGTVVESELEAPVARRGMPVWVWAVAGIIAVVGLYFIFSRDMPDRSVAISPPAPEPVASVPAEPPPAPQAEAPQAAETQAPAPSTLVAEPPPPVVDPPQAAVAKKPVDRPTPTKTASVAAPIATKPVARVEPPPTRSAPKKALAPAPSAVPAAPLGPDDVAGVETLPDPALAAPAATLSPGALIPIDEADTMPVSLSRRLPVYSEQARQMRLSGTVVLNALVNEKGTVDQVVLVIGVPGADLNDAAMRAAKTWTYRPATKNGIPVKVWKSEQIAFKR